MELSRREALVLALGLPLAAACSRVRPPRLPPGEVVGGSHGFGHRVRAHASFEVPERSWQKMPVVVVGAGVAGLSAAWQLARAGLRPGQDFVVLELEAVGGGTARAGANAVSAHPWGAHYLPLPQRNNVALLQLLRELGALEGEDELGEPVLAEVSACRDPQERLFYRGQWTEGLYLHAGASAEDLRQRAAFQALVDGWVAFRDGAGRRAFVLPVAACSDDPVCTALDQIDAASYLHAHGLHSPRLLWYVDYACRDDYGTDLGHTSAWAMLFYFAARVARPGADSQPLLTWPQGNGRLVEHLVARVAPALRCDTLVAEIVPTVRGNEVVALERSGEALRAYRCDQVIFAAPQFIARHVLRPYREAPPPHLGAFSQSAWVVANLTLRQRPLERGFPLAWDNVLYDSPSLGYVAATHQQDRETGPTVLTYYHAASDRSGTAARQQLLGLSQPQWADVVLSDLRRAHPDLPNLVEQLDVMVWGHAMVRPTPGLVWGQARRQAQKPYRDVHFAHAELSGMALFEEAFDHGLRAADEVLVKRQRTQRGW